MNILLQRWQRNMHSFFQGDEIIHEGECVRVAFQHSSDDEVQQVLGFVGCTGVPQLWQYKTMCLSLKTPQVDEATKQIKRQNIQLDKEDDSSQGFKKLRVRERERKAEIHDNLLARAR